MEAAPKAIKIEAHEEVQDVPGERYFIRLNRSEKIQHMIFAGCFIALVVTGFITKIPEEIIAHLGKYREPIFYYRSILHRIAGVVLICVCLYHVYYLFLKPAGRRWLVDMLPRQKDVLDMLFNLLYYLGLKKEAPEFDRFSYKHKMEYGALIAGSTLMSVSGLILWTEYRWVKFIVDIAAVVHRMEAVLACLAIIVWHLYEVLLKPGRSFFNDMWRTGLMTEEEMKEEHLGHYRKIMSDPKLQEIYILKKQKEFVHS